MNTVIQQKVVNCVLLVYSSTKLHVVSFIVRRRHGMTCIAYRGHGETCGSDRQCYFAEDGEGYILSLFSILLVEDDSVYKASTCLCYSLERNRDSVAT